MTDAYYPNDFVPSGSDNEQVLSDLADLTSAFTLSILNSSPDCIKLIELDGSLSFMNINGQCAMEIDDFSMIADQPWPSLWPDAAKELLLTALSKARAGETSQFDAFCPTAKGAPRWWNVSVSPVIGKSGRVERILSTSRDITDRIEHEKLIGEHERQIAAYAQQLRDELTAKNDLLKQRDVLAREVDHRVKNSLSLVSGLLRLQSREVEDDGARTAIEDAANRVQTIAQVHEHLQIDEDQQSIMLDVFLKDMCRAVVDGISAGRTTLSVIGEPVSVPSDVAVALGLVATELVINAVKHGRKNADLKVGVTLSQPSPGTLELGIEDDGTGLPEDYDFDQCDGLGMKVCRTYSRQLGGQITHGRSVLGGARFALTFAL